MGRRGANSVHLVVPGGYFHGGECIDRIAAQLYLSGRVDGLDTSCVAAEPLPPFALGPAR